MSLISLTDEQSAAVEEMAAHGFSVTEILEVTEIDTSHLSMFVIQRGSLYAAYRKGFLRSQLELRQRIFKDAQHGSSPAQALAKKILDDAEFKMNQ